MPAPPPPPSAQPESLLSRFGVPVLAGNRRFVSAAAVDSIGTGLIMTFTVVFFVSTTTVSLPTIGLAMTLARLLALPTSVTVGPLLDRFGARRVAAVGNLISSIGYSGFLLAEHPATIIAVLFLVQIGHTTYWTSSAALVVLASPEDRRTRWFGFVHALRNAGLGVGAALGAFAYGLGGTTGLEWIAVGNAVSFLFASFLLARWRPERERRPVPTGGEDLLEATEDEATGYRAVLRDRRYTLLMAINVTFVFAQMLIKILLAIYIVDALDGPAWIAGALLVLNTVQVTALQTLVSRQMERHRVTRVIVLASLLDAVAFALFAALYWTPEVGVVVGLFVAMAVFTLGEITGAPALDNLSASLAPEALRGRYLAVYQLSWTVGEIAAPAVLTYLLARGAVLPLLLLLGLALVAVPMALALERRQLPGPVSARPTPAESANPS